MADRSTRQAYALAHPINSAAALTAPRELQAVDELPGGDLLLTILAVDR